MHQERTVVTAILTMDHYDSVFALWRGCEGMGLSDADSREGVDKYLQRNPEMSRVALDNDRVVGAVLVGHDGRRGSLNHLAVHADYRGRGIGRLLLAEALEVLRAAGIEKCHGLVYRNNLGGLAFWRAADWRVHEDISLISKNIAQER